MGWPQSHRSKLALWENCRPILHELDYHPELKALREEEMGHIAGEAGFDNNIKGAFFF